MLGKLSMSEQLISLKHQNLLNKNNKGKIAFSWAKTVEKRNQNYITTEISHKTMTKGNENLEEVIKTFHDSQYLCCISFKLTDSIISCIIPVK